MSRLIRVRVGRLPPVDPLGDYDDAALWANATNPDVTYEQFDADFKIDNIVELASSGSEPRVIMVPDGNYTWRDSASISGVPRSQWLVVVPETPGGAQLEQLTRWHGFQRVMFVGWNFRRCIRLEGYEQNSDRVVFFACRNSTEFSTVGDPTDTWRKAVHVIGATGHIWVVGGDLEDIAEDAVFFSGVDNARLQGVRVYDLGGGDWGGHDDSVQTTGSVNNLRVMDFSTGYRPGADRSSSVGGNGRHQYGAETGNMDGIHVERGWVTNAGFAFTFDKKTNNITNASVDSAHVWGTGFGTINANVDVSVTNLTESVPPSSVRNPADVWREANPYSSAIDWLNARIAAGEL